MCLEVATMGQSYSLLCQGMVPLHPLLKCFCPGHSYASHQSSKLKRPYIVKKNVLNDVRDADDRCGAFDVMVTCGQRGLVRDSIVIPVGKAEHCKIADLKLDASNSVCARTNRHPVISVLKTNDRFSGSIELLDVRTKEFHRNKVNLAVGYHNSDDVCAEKMSTINSVDVGDDDTGVNLKFCDSHFAAKNNCMESIFDLRLPDNQNICKKISDSCCFVKFPQASTAQKISTRLEPHEHSFAVHTSEKKIFDRDVASVNFSSQADPPMDSSLGSLERNSQHSTEEQHWQKDSENATPSNSKTHPRVTDGKIRWQESVTSISKNLRVKLFDTLATKVGNHFLKVKFTCLSM